MATVGEKLAAARRRAGLTQQDLAAAVGVGVTTVSRWEQGVAEPSFRMLRELRRILDLDVSKLLDEC